MPFKAQKIAWQLLGVFLSWDSGVYFERALPLKIRTINIRSLHLDGKIGFQISHLKLVVQQEWQKRYK